MEFTAYATEDEQETMRVWLRNSRIARIEEDDTGEDVEVDVYTCDNPSVRYRVTDLSFDEAVEQAMKTSPTKRRKVR